MGIFKETSIKFTEGTETLKIIIQLYLKNSDQEFS